MSLAYEYGINTGNRFIDLLDHDEDPDELIATQAKTEEKSKKTSKDVKSATTTTTTKKKSTPTATATASTTNVSSSATKTNKENITGKSQNNDQRRQQQQTNVLGDNNYQQTRPDSGRGGWQGSARRGGGAGQERPPYEGGSRGGGQQRVQRYNKFEGQQTSTEASGFEQSGEGWRTEGGNDNQQFGESRGRGRGRGRGNYEGGRGRGNYEGGRGRGNYEGGRGRGNYEGGRGRGNYEGGRGRGNYEGGRGNYEGGRGRGGRGNYGNRSIDEASQQQQQQQPSTQETGGWETSADANFDNNAAAATRTAGQDFDADVVPQERPFEPGSRRGGRGNFRSRTFHNNRNYGSDRANQQEREGDQEDYRRNRRQHDRQPRNYLSGVKAIEKKDGEGAHNWGSPTENPEDIPAVDETADTAGQAASSSKGWAEQVEEAEKQITLDEYKKQIEAKKRAQQEKVPQFKLRTAGEGEDPKNWKPVAQEYRKKNEGEQGEDDDAEEGDSEGSESGEDTEEQASGKKKVITIPLRFKPIEPPRGGPAGSRGGSRRGGRFHDRPNRDEHPRSKSPSQQQPSYYQQPGEYYNDEQQQQQQQSRPYRGGSGRGGSGRGEYRRSYANSARGSRGGGYTRATSDSNTPDFENTVDFPTLPK